MGRVEQGEKQGKPGMREMRRVCMKGGREGRMREQEGEQEVALERVREVNVRRRVVRLSAEVQEDESRVRRR